MVLLVAAGVQGLELVPVRVALPAKVKIITVLTHPTILAYHPLAIKTLDLLLVQELLLEDRLEFMVRSMGLRKIILLRSGPLEKTFLTCIKIHLHSLKFLQLVQLMQTPMIGF